MGNNDLPFARLAAFDLMPVDSQSLARVVEEAVSRTQGLKGAAAADAFAMGAMQAAQQGADSDEAHALFTRAQIFRECLLSCARQLAEAKLPVISEQSRARLIYGVAHARVKIAPRLDGATRINYNIGEIIGIAKSLPSLSAAA